MNSDKTINVPGFGQLEWENSNIDYIFKRTSCFIGLSDTGKSTLMKHYLKKIAHLIPNILLICPTAGATGDWDGIIHPRCIINKPSPEKFKDIMDRQEAATAVYIRANNLATLESLANKTDNIKGKWTVRLIKRKSEIYLSRIKRNRNLDHAQQMEEKKKIEDEKVSSLRKLYRNMIKSDIKMLSKMVGLTDSEKYTLRFIDFNPSLLMIMDDCAADIKKWGKDPTIAKLFFESRHFWITSWYSLQDDKLLAPAIRKNTFMTCFTDQQSASSFFDNKANNFGRDFKKKAGLLAERLLRESDTDTKNYKKLIYSRKDRKPLRYVIAERHAPFKMGNRALWQLCENIPMNKNSNIISKDSKFSKAFRI